MGVLDIPDGSKPVYDTTAYYDIEHLTTGSNSQNDKLKLHYNSMYNQQPELAKEFLGTWDDFAGSIAQPDSASVYFDTLFEKGLVTRADYKEYYKSLYTPYTSTHNQKINKVNDKSKIENIEFDTTIKFDVKGEKIDVGTVKIDEDGTVTKIDKKEISKELSRVIALPTTIPSLLYLLDPRHPFDINNPGIVNYNTIITGGGLKQRGRPTLHHPEAFEEGEYVGEEITSENLELKILNRIKQSGEVDFQKLFDGDEEAQNKFLELYKESHYEINLESDSRLKGKAKDVDLKGLNKELDNFLEAFISTQPLNEHEGWRKFKEDYLLNIEISDMENIYTHYDAETIEAFSVNGFYNPVVNNFLNTKNLLNNIILPSDMNGDMVVDEIDAELMVEYQQALKYIMSNPDYHFLLPEFMRHGEGVPTQLYLAPEFSKETGASYFKNQYPQFSMRLINPDDPSQGSWGYMAEYTEDGELIGPHEGMMYKPTREQAYLWKILGNPKLVESLEKIFDKYEKDKSKENYQSNVKSVMLLESENEADNYIGNIQDYTLRDQYIADGYSLINAETNEFLDEPDTVSRTVQRYGDINNYRIHMGVLQGFQNAYNDMGYVEAFANTILGSFVTASGGATAHLSDVFFEKFTDAVNSSMDTAFPKESIMKYVEILRAEYPHFDKYIKENQSTLAWLGEKTRTGASIGTDLLGLINTTKLVGKLGGGALFPNIGTNISLGARTMIVSGTGFSLHTVADMTFDPNNPVGFYRKDDSKGLSKYAWNQSAGEYLRDVSIPAISSFVVGAVFPKLGNAHSTGLSMSGYKTLETLGRGEIQAHLKSIGGFLLESGYLTSAGMVDAFVQTGWAVYNQQFEEGYRGKPITFLDALDTSFEMLIFGGEEAKWTNVDPTLMVENFMMMTFLHGAGNYRKFDFRTNEKYKQELYNEKLLEGELKEVDGVLQINVENWEVRNNYLQYKHNKVLMDMAEIIIETKPIPEYVKKGAKNADDIRRINQWWKNEYREPEILLGQIKTLLAQFHGKKIWIPKIVADPSGKEATVWDRVDYGSPEMKKWLLAYENGYMQLYAKSRSHPGRVNEGNLTKAYEELWEMYARNEFALGALNGLDFKTTKDRTLSYMTIPLQGGKVMQVDPFTNSIRVIDAVPGSQPISGFGPEIKVGN
jgi:hypothetical protein